MDRDNWLMGALEEVVGWIMRPIMGNGDAQLLDWWASNGLVLAVCIVGAAILLDLWLNGTFKRAWRFFHRLFTGSESGGKTPTDKQIGL